MVILPFLVSGFTFLLGLLGLTVGVPAVINTLFGWLS
jgi:hypothetical protein